MTPERLTEIEAMVREATPGPWKSDRDPLRWEVVTAPNDHGYPVCYVDWDNYNDDNNLALITAAPTIIRELLDEIERLQTELEVERGNSLLPWNH